MKIGNTTALYSSRLMNETSQAINRSLTRLSSGKRINEARDDLAGFSSLVGLNSSIRGLSQANLNINHGIGLLQTADSAISVQSDILQRMRELAVQGASGSLTAADRTNITTELSALVEEFQRITLNTEFDGTKILDGTFGSKDLQIGSNKGDELAVEIGSLQSSAIFLETVGSGSFVAQSTFAVGNDPDASELADMNNDGKLDLVVANDTDDTISVALGNGDGTFQAAQTITSDGDPKNIVVGDLNGDGLNDVAVYDTAGGGTLGVYLGNGDGSLQVRQTFDISVSDSAGNLVLTDIDGDDDLDAVVSSGGATDIAFLLNNGDGTFQATASLDVVKDSGELVAGDFNNDGYGDVFTMSFDSGVGQVLFGSSSGSFTEGATADFTTGISNINSEVGDFNNDGILDLIVSAGSGATVDYYAGNGDGTFAAAVNLSSGGILIEMKAGDFNNDGNLDFAGVSTSNSYVYSGNGSGSFSLAGSAASTIGAFNLAVGDLNSDGVLDFIGGDNTNDDFEVFLQNSTTQSAVTNLNVSSVSNANRLIDIVDTAIDNLNEERVQLAGSLTQLQSILDYNLLVSESLVAARSSIEDADIGIETTNLVELQIRQQAQIAALSQSNLNMQVVMNLFQF